MNDQLESICKRMNKIKKEKKNKDFKSFFDSGSIPFFKKEYLQLFKELNDIKKEKIAVNWEAHIEPLLNLNHDVSANDIQEMIDSLVFRSVTFIYPLGGTILNKKITLSKHIKIVPINSLKASYTSLFISNKKDFEHLRHEYVSVICINKVCEEENDFFESENVKEIALQIVDILNFNSKCILLGKNLNKYRLINPREFNGAKVGRIICPFKIVNNQILANEHYFYDGSLDEELYSIEHAGDIDINGVKNNFDNLFQKDCQKNRILLQVISLVNSSIVDRNKSTAFLKLVMAIDTLLERENEYDKRDIRTQLFENFIYILGLPYKGGAVQKLRTLITSVYDDRSIIIHQGKDPSKLKNIDEEYKSILVQFRAVINHLINDDRFRKIDSMTQVFELIDREVFLENRLLAFSVLKVIKEDGSLDYKDLNNSVRYILDTDLKDHSFTKFSMLNTNYTKKSLMSVIEKLENHKYIVLEEDNKYALISEKIDPEEIDYKKIFNYLK